MHPGKMNKMFNTPKQLDLKFRRVEILNFSGTRT
jgi:hypothetical protein